MYKIYLMKKLFSILFSIAFLLVFVSLFSQKTLAVCSTGAYSGQCPAGTTQGASVGVDTSNNYQICYLCAGGSIAATCAQKGGTCYGGYSCTGSTQMVGGPGQLGCSGVCCAPNNKCISGNGQQPNCPTILSPTNGVVINPGSQEITWSP